MPKLFSKPTKYVKIKLTIRLPSDVADELKDLTAQAKADGLEATLEDAIAAYLIRAIGHARSEMRKAETKP